MRPAEIEQYRLQQVTIAEVVSADASVYARSIMDLSPERFAQLMREAVESLARMYGPVSGEAAALFYETQRPKSGGRVVVGSPMLGDALSGSLGWAFTPMFAPSKFVDPVGSVLTRVGAVASRSVLDAGRSTMWLSAQQDRFIGGVRRYARASACAFCAYLCAIEADVAADTHWHDDCRCVSVPFWEDNPFPSVEHIDVFGEAARQARSHIEADYREKRALAPDLRRRNFYRQFPETALTTENVVAVMRKKLNAH